MEKFGIEIPLSELERLPNIAEELTEDQKTQVAELCIRGHGYDLQSRVAGGWEDWYARAMECAMQISEVKTFPWVGCSNVRFPLLTVAALSFHARAYSALLPHENYASAYVVGGQKTAKQEAAARRVGWHLSYQLREEMPQWESDHDRMMLILSIIGTAFKKTYFDASAGVPASELVLPGDLAVNYWSKNIESATRVTHLLTLTHNEVEERIRVGEFSDVDVSAYPATIKDQIRWSQDRTQMVTSTNYDSDTPKQFIEQHRWLDLDGDGYQEPYVVTVHCGSRKLVRIVARFLKDGIQKIGHGRSRKVVHIEPINYWTKYGFIPSPDGGFYDLAFGRLLYHINSSVDTIINQQIDAGTMATLGGGFMGRGVRVKGGEVQMRPHLWVRADAPGGSLRDNIVPLPVKEPSPVMLQLLQYLVHYAEFIASSNDVQMGENVGQNTPAETARTMNENGQRIFAAIYKRHHLAMTHELQKIRDINQQYFRLLSSYEDLTMAEPEPLVMLSDYRQSFRVRPTADPFVASDEKRLQQALTVRSMSREGAGYNTYEADKRVLRLMRVEDMDSVYPDPQGPNAIPSPPSIEQMKIQIAQMKEQRETMALQLEHQRKTAELMQSIEVDQAEILKLHAETVKLLKEAEGVEEGHNIAKMQNMLANAKLRLEGKVRAMEILLSNRGLINEEKKLSIEAKKLEQGPAEGGASSRRKSSKASGSSVSARS